MDVTGTTRSGYWRTLGWIGIAGVAVTFGAVAYRLESTRDRDILVAAGSRVALREDGSPLTMGLTGEILSDDHLKHVGRLKRLDFLALENGHCSAGGLACLGSLDTLKGLTLRQVHCPPGSLNAIGTLASLSSLTIENCLWVGDEDVRAISKHKQLESLTLHGTSITDAGLEHLLSCERLDALDLQNSSLISPSALIQFGERKQLKSLDVRGIVMTSDEFLRLHKSCPTTSVEASSELLSDMQPLLQRQIDIYQDFGTSPSGDGSYGGFWTSPDSGPSATFNSCDVDNEVLTLLVDRAPDLTHLSFGNTNLADEHMPIIGRFENLKGLNIFDSTGSLTANGFEQMVDSALTYLRVRTGRVNDRCLEALARIRTLEELALSGPMTDEGVVHVQRLRKLTLLELSHSSITGSRIDELFGLRNLRFVSFAGSPINDAGLLKLANLNVKWISIWNSQVTVEGIRQFQKLRPDVSLAHDVGGVVTRITASPRSGVSPETAQ